MTTDEATALLHKALAREAEKDKRFSEMKVTLPDGTRVSVNPKYIESPFELALFGCGGKINEVWPYRFSTQKQSEDYFSAKNADIRAYATPYFLVIKPDGTSYESW